jgi:hypothetical protein
LDIAFPNPTPRKEEIEPNEALSFVLMPGARSVDTVVDADFITNIRHVIPATSITVYSDSACTKPIANLPWQAPSDIKVPGGSKIGWKSIRIYDCDEKEKSNCVYIE